ncbi:DUF1684 domain-containing protein [Abyssalbus ytuae]|uniref:DUF1684 domain-containing protein n=1 Tax=Abyssalbus ytuae TaxID=2926907 RepID=A0A9E6ZM29_9FLAO|nr:DUF1684 domain-containing protein [Abyssalbus ytuae]UOB16775.1 DUF1684 domain-containing protein [Abyssalbus ytuae]
MKYLLFFFLFFLSGCRSDKKYHDEDKEIVVKKNDSADYFSQIQNFRKKINEEFINPEKSPLTEEDLKTFKGLKFFPPDSLFKVEARFVRTDNEKPFFMLTTTTRTPVYTKFGELQFMLSGNNYTLNLYQNTEIILTRGYEDYLFLPFTDLTNGEETYGGGRYIDMRIPEGNTVIIDFNKAYNPYCAYNKKYSCPLVPSENNLDIEIRAGVKKFKK